MSPPNTSGQLRKADISYRHIFAIAIPMTIAYASQPILGLVDTAVAGRLDNVTAIGGLAIGAIIFDFIFTIFAFLRFSVLGLTAQAYGRSDDVEIEAVFLRGIAIAVLAGGLVLLGAPLLVLLGIWAFGLEGELAQIVRSYFLIRVLSMPMALINYTIAGHMLGLGRPKTVLILQLLLNGTNIIGSIYLGLTLNWGIEGIAFGTLIGETVAAALGLAIWYFGRNNRSWPRLSVLLDAQKLKVFWALNRDISIRTVCLFFCFAIFIRIGTNFGETTLASNAVLIHFLMLAAFLLDGFATSAEQMVGQSLGAKDRIGFTTAIRKTMLCSIAYSMFIFALYLLAGRHLIGFLVTEPKVIAEANTYLIWAIATPLTGAAAFLLDGVFVGASWGRDMRNGMIVSFCVFIAIAGLATYHHSNQLLWIALHVFFIFRALTLMRVLNRNIDTAFANH